MYACMETSFINMSIGETVTLSSANVRGLGLHSAFKATDVINYFKDRKYDIICLQDTHWTEKDETKIKNIWGGNCIINGLKTNARGVAILFGNNFEYKLIKTEKDSDGNMVVVDMVLSNLKIKLINIYGPNQDTPSFYTKLSNYIHENAQDYLIICGDYNLVINPQLDSHNYTHINNPKARDTLLSVISDNNLVDIYRHLHPTTKRYTWRMQKPIKQARLDYIFINDTFSDIVSKCDIHPGYKSDHSIVSMEILINRFEKGKGIWKFNTNLLSDPNYIKLVHDVIDEERLNYALPVYNLDYINQPYSLVEPIIDYDLFLEILLMSIRGKTIKYATTQKRIKIIQEEKLLNEIEIMEKEPLSSTLLDVLSQKKDKLELIRKEKISGIIVRSRIETISIDEKPSAYFCSLESKNYIEKTVKKTIINNKIINNQKEILVELGNFYSKLYENRDNTIPDICLDELLCGYSINKLSNNESLSLEGKINEQELSEALSNMKNNKTPGMDGFPSEFFKFFWFRLKHYVLKALNTSYDKGLLTTTFRHSIISCLPKGDKPREFLKNWRPISLLSVVYKLASAVISNRLKSVLDKIITDTQTGFVPGRYIGDSTRLVYDIMHYTEKNNIDGMLLLIDFEKAFDSLSWSFLYKTLIFFGFRESIIKWVQLLNNNIKASVIQCGILSEPFIIGRGAKQGDPIAPYLFIICGEILSIMIKNNISIKGITIENVEHKLTQFADDTTMFLNGTRESLQAALNTIEIFGTYSGLKINAEKTKVIWIGRRNNSSEKINVSMNLSWGETNFSLLGLEFFINLSQMIETNFEKALSSCKSVMNTWKKRNMSPLGRITVIKTFIFSKLNHLFMSLPNPKPEFIKKLNQLIYNFIWEGKPDKIARKLITQDKLKGGLALPDTNNVIFSLKTTWIRKFLKNNPPWKSIIDPHGQLLNSLTLFGPLFLNATKISNPFWIDVFGAWQMLCNNRKDFNLIDILSTPIWYNPQISEEIYYLKSWHNKGICFVKDIINTNGDIMTINELLNNFGITIINFLQYAKFKKLITKFLKRVHYNSDNFISGLGFVILPSHISILFKSSKGSRDMYSILNKNEFIPKYMSKWNEDLNVIIDPITWKNAFHICFKVFYNAHSQWLQYRIINRIIGTNEYLYKVKISDSGECRLCFTENESILHLFATCQKTRTLLNDLEIWIKNKINFNLCTNHMTMILGYLIKDNNYTPLNFILLETKKYIFHCASKNKSLCITTLKSILKTAYNDNKMVYETSKMPHSFNKIWEKWSPLFL